MAVKWVNIAEKNKLPPIDTEDGFNRANGFSKRVVVWVKFENSPDVKASARFGWYSHKSKRWVIEGMTGSTVVTHYASIPKPK